MIILYVSIDYTKNLWFEKKKYCLKNGGEKKKKTDPPSAEIFQKPPTCIAGHFGGLHPMCAPRPSNPRMGRGEKGKVGGLSNELCECVFV